MGTAFPVRFSFWKVFWATLLPSFLASVAGILYFKNPHGASVMVALVLLLLFLASKRYRRPATVLAVSTGLAASVVIFELGYFIWLYFASHDDSLARF
jgi:predicted branched-subunit amino acid permease